MDIARTGPTAWIAALVAAPAIVGALGLSAIEGYRIFHRESSWFGNEPAPSLAAAITRGFGVESAYTFIRAGQDPNDPIAVDDPQYVGEHPRRVTPLMLAVAARDSNVVSMLLNFGARLDVPQSTFAECLARQIDADEILEILERERGSGVSPPCPDRPQEQTPLLRWAD